MHYWSRWAHEGSLEMLASRRSSQDKPAVRPATGDVGRRLSQPSRAPAPLLGQGTHRSFRTQAKLRANDTAMARAELLASEQAAALQHRLKFGATKLSCNLEDTVIAVDVSPDGEYFAAGGLKEVAVVGADAPALQWLKLWPRGAQLLTHCIA